MALKRLGALSLTVLVTLGVQTAHGAPTRAIQSLRAVSCCTTHCDHARSGHAARQCCGVHASDGDTATLDGTSSPRAPAAPVGLVVPTAVAPALAGIEPAPVHAAQARGAPLFLLTHALRV